MTDGRDLGGDRQFTRHGIAERTAAREGDPHKADARLRQFGPRIGDAVLCPVCYGEGLVPGYGLAAQAYGTHYNRVLQPVKCSECNGEGLDPLAYQGPE